MTAPSGNGSKKNLFPSSTYSTTESAKTSPLATQSIDELKEESSINDKDSPKMAKSPSKESTDVMNPLKARFLTFSRRLKGTVTGASHSNLPSMKKTPTVDLKTKNNSTAKLFSLSNKPGLPSASAYDITQNSSVQQLPKGLEEYYVIRRVGKGGFATVFLIRLKASTGRYFALKVIKKAEVVRLKQEKQIMNEKNILMELKHPLLVDLYSCFQSPSNLFMVMEFVAGGDLFTQLRKVKV